jgi:alanyl-tRNA synthetase
VTRRLYQADAYAVEFESTITGVGPHDTGLAVVLEATLFYPEVGGQPCDAGWIGDVRIERVVEAEGEILHLAGAPVGGASVRAPAASQPALRQGQTVRARIDWPRRFLNMQQHTGQHVLSQAFLQVLGAQTVSSRLGTEHSTIDVAKLSLTWDDAGRVERAANAVIYEDRPVKVYEARADQLAGVRAKKEPAGGLLRIVEVDGFDISPCGGTHVRRAGEVGLVKILRWERVRDASRVEFICGVLAEADYFWKSRAIVELAHEFTTKDTGVPEMVRRWERSSHDLTKEVAGLRGALIDYRVRDFEGTARTVAGARLVATVLDGEPPGAVREIASRLVAPGGMVALVMSRGERVHFVFARSADIAIDIRQAAQAAAAVLGGKGGGKPEASEGGGKLPERAEAALAAAVEKVEALLAGRA